MRRALRSVSARNRPYRTADTRLRTATPSIEDRPAAVSSFKNTPMHPQRAAAVRMYQLAFRSMGLASLPWMHYNGTPVGEQSLSYQKQRGKNKMRYDKICAGRFLARPNRFIAHVEVGGEVQVCHVKNTGRCRELLVPGARVWLEESANPARKTRYDLVAVEKQTARGALLINMDSQAPNRVFGEWAAAGGLGFVPALLKPEMTYGNSRFDYYWELSKKAAEKGFVEVKGVTLEEDGVARFPDAPHPAGG